MSLLWKLLRRHISVGQFAGFSLANLFGMSIVLLAVQFYEDVKPVFTADDSFMHSDYQVVSKRVGMGGTLSGGSGTFSGDEIGELKGQPFIRELAAFTANDYKATANISIGGTTLLNSEVFFESVPDGFIDAPKDVWQFKPGDNVVPIILPRAYLTMYNFGFARSRSLPRVGEGLASTLDVSLYIHGGGKEATLKGQVVGFSSRMSSVMVPQAFMDWSNALFGSGEPQPPTRLIFRSDGGEAKRLTSYLDDHGYELEDNRMQQEKAASFLRLVVSMVTIVGLVISALSFYILMLSVFLLVQKNSRKLQTLLLIGYSPGQVARPYQLLTIGLNVAVLAIAVCLLFVTRHGYMEMIAVLLPEEAGGSMLPALGVGLGLLLLVSLCNVVAIRRKISSIWNQAK